MTPSAHDAAAARRTAAAWSGYEPDVAQRYFGFPPLRPYLVETAFGPDLAALHRDNRWWAEDIVADLYLRPRRPRTMLSLCCGFGAVEQHFATSLETLEHCVAVDLAEGAAIAAARRAAECGLGRVIRYEVADLNRYRWPRCTYDVVVANGALHHLAQLDGVLDGIAACLTHDGILYANEHVGARHQDFPARQLELINAVAHIVPPRWRSRHTRRRNPFWQPVAYRLTDILLGNTDAPVPRPDWSAAKRGAAALLTCLSLPPSRRFGPLVESNLRSILQSDPSEGVSSDRIIDAVLARFADVHIHPYGGALLAYALDPAFYRAFDPDDPAHRRLLDVLCALEAALVQLGDLGEEHAIIVATAAEGAGDATGSAAASGR